MNNNLDLKEERILRTLKKGDYFGEQALLSGKTIKFIGKEKRDYLIKIQLIIYPLIF